MGSEIWVCADFTRSSGRALLTWSRQISDQVMETAAVCFETIDSRIVKDSGADIIYSIEAGGSDFLLSKYLREMAEQYLPQIILFPAEGIYPVIAARTAALLKTGLTADCRDLYMDKRNLLHQVRPAYGGGMIAEICCEKARPQMATVNTNDIPGIAPEPGKGKIVQFEPKRKFKDPVKFLGRKIISVENDIRESSIIVAGGKGIGSRQGFEEIKKLAEKIGGALGATRSAVDAGYADYRNQIGQTGMNVCPDLYIALGISGSPQHIAGMNRSGKVIAVNTDSKAPIFDYADIAITASWKDFTAGMLES